MTYDDINIMDSLEENGMNNFEDANVDKDLLNQIFADEGEDFSLEDAEEEQLNLDEAVFDMGGTAAEENVLAEEKPEEENIFEESILEEAAPEEDVVEEEEVTGQEEDIPEETAEPEEDIPEEEPVLEPSVPSAANDDIVNEEARRAMDEARLNGTVTVITEDTKINGSISSEGSLEVMGVITGDIECLGKVYINGNVSGGIVASEIFVNTPKLHGGLISEGTVKIGVGTIVLGDVTGTSAYIAGAVKGNIDIDGPVIVESTAIVKGDIKAKSITINSGAVVDGYCSLNYAGVDIDQFFDEE